MLADAHVGWLRPAEPADTAAICPPEQPGRAERLPAPFASWQASVQSLLAELAASASPLARASFVRRAAETIGGAVWATLLAAEAGWLAPLPGRRGQAAIVPPDQRKQPALGGSLAGAEPLIEQIFDLHRQQIGTPSPRATFAGGQALREGWVKLRSVS